MEKAQRFGEDGGRHSPQHRRMDRRRPPPALRMGDQEKQRISRQGQADQ
jgi:hypothetical protein